MLLLRRSILTEKIARRGQHITREYGIDPFEFARARDIMIEAVDTLASSMTVAETCAFFTRAVENSSSLPCSRGRRQVVSRLRGDVLRWQGDRELAGQSLGNGYPMRRSCRATPAIQSAISPI